MELHSTGDMLRVRCRRGRGQFAQGSVALEVEGVEGDSLNMVVGAFRRNVVGAVISEIEGNSFGVTGRTREAGKIEGGSLGMAICTLAKECVEESTVVSAGGGFVQDRARDSDGHAAYLGWFPAAILAAVAMAATKSKATA